MSAWTVEPSETAKGTTNPIREIVDQLDFNNLPKNKELSTKSLFSVRKNIFFHVVCVEFLFPLVTTTKRSCNFFPLPFFSSGDPTKFGNLPVPKAAVAAVTEILKEGDDNGYGPSFGLPKARVAIAERYSQKMGRKDYYTPMDVFLGSGCSGILLNNFCCV